MRQLVFLGLYILVIGCTNKPQKEDVNHLNGYWEIVEVEFNNGHIKEYSISTTIDYIEYNGKEGFRKKVQPQLNGSYQTSDDAEQFKISESNEQLTMIYGQGTEQWEEILIAINENTFSVRTTEGTIYRYKRYEPLNLAN